MRVSSYKISPRCTFEWDSFSGDDQSVICAVPGGEAVVLSGSGAIIWLELSEKFQSTDEITSAVASYFEIDPSTIQAAVMQTLQALHSHDLLEGLTIS